ncbi:hypothetical protein [Mangrovicella endophytica]|uniref:hypothetical protein n=1 Tax=Mangrovicella endophytica TaxID=2066697 RepID=UPI000C9EA99F|nr:hypothetical protein [Mangrovicella endophytica]
MQAKKTHEQMLRTLERKDDLPDERRLDAEAHAIGQDDAVHHPKPGVRESEFPVSRGGMNQESRHNKHNDGGSGGKA